MSNDLDLSPDLSSDVVLSQRYYNVLSETYIAFSCFLHRTNLFFCRSPQTPLRVLCIIAYDALHALNGSRRLSSDKVHLLSAVLDFAACVNAALDHKQFKSDIYQKTRARIYNAGSARVVDDFVRRLQMLECRGRRTSEHSCGFENARHYREAVVRLNMGLLASIVFDLQSLDEGIQLTHESNLDLLFRIVMLCQIIDDILDYQSDSTNELPSFLTSSQLRDALSQTSLAAQSYADQGSQQLSNGCYPFRCALACVSTITRTAIQYANWKYQPSAAPNR